MGWMYSARARLMRMRQPPEKELVARFCITMLKPANGEHYSQVMSNEGDIPASALNQLSSAVAMLYDRPVSCCPVSICCYNACSPSPCRIFDARASAEWLPISCMRSYTSLRRAPPASASKSSSSSSSGDWPFACGGVAASPPPPLPLAAAAPSGTAAPPASCKSPASAPPQPQHHPQV